MMMKTNLGLIIKKAEADLKKDLARKSAKALKTKKATNPLQIIEPVLAKIGNKLKNGKWKLHIPSIKEHTTFAKPNDRRTKRRPIVAYFQGSGAEPYEIKAHELHGLSCSCKSWLYWMDKKKDAFAQMDDKVVRRTCKHTREAMKHIGW